MNAIEVLKNKLKRMDRFHRQQLLVYFMLFGFMFGETYVLIKLFLIANQYSQELITLEEFTALQNEILVFMLIIFLISISGMVLMYFYIKSQEKNDKEIVN